MTNADWKWWALFVGQVAVGVYLYTQDVEFAKFLLGSAFGQGVTGGIGPIK